EREQEREQERNENIIKLLTIINGNQLSVFDLMNTLQLNGRRNFLYTYLNPALKSGYITMLYPDKPKHRNQRYFLTTKGKAAVKKYLKRKKL
ncbi:MAG: cell filamentation protein Fic, partial [Prevotellaceae bacterium]|nr:cell filamentation protein Fic [Prevotellaceae bacterium]